VIVMNEKNLQKSDMVYGVPCTCGNLATIATRDSGTHKSTYWCACDRRYIRDDRTGEVTVLTLSEPAVSRQVNVMLTERLDRHYAERSTATGKPVQDLILEDLGLSFNRWRRAQARQEIRIFRENESERL